MEQVIDTILFWI